MTQHWRRRKQKRLGNKDTGGGKNLGQNGQCPRILRMWLGSHNLCATQKEYRAQNKQMTAVGNSSDSEEIVKASQSNFQHDGAAASKLSERSPLPPALSEMDLPGGQTEVVDVRWIEGINRHPAESDEDRSPESMSDTNTWLNFNGD